MRSRLTWLATVVAVAGIVVSGPANAQPVEAAAAVATSAAAPYCGIYWGSTDKSGDGVPLPGAGPLINVRAGQHDCYDRLVIDLDGPGSHYTVRYVPAVLSEGTGDAIALRGGAFLEVDLQTSAYDPNTGAPTYTPADPAELVTVTGWRTLRQVAWGGSFEGYTTIGVGVRARLPFRVFTLTGPGPQSRLVIDVAHQW